MLKVDRLSESDIDAALRLSTAAGWNQLGADWRRLIDLWPQFCLAGRVDGAVVATATLAVYPQTDAGLHASSVGWVGMILVDPAHRRRGYGGAMFDAILAAAHEASVQHLGLDATDLGRPLYLERGFRDEHGIDRWVRTGNARTPRGPSERRVLTAGNMDERLLVLDRKASGGDRTALLRHLCAEQGVQTWVCEAPSGLCGFAVVRPGRTAWHLGPIVAEDRDSAAALLYAVNGNVSRPLLVDVPRGRFDADMLKSVGFELARPLTRMRRGEAENPALSGQRVYAAAGFELG